MASISTIAVNSAPRSASRGFTLIELMIAAALSAVVFTAIFSAYIFLARNLARLAHTQRMLVQSRDTFYRLGKDVNEATAVTSASDSRLVLTLSSGTVTYAYDSAAGTLTRTLSGGTAVTLVTKIAASSFSFYYYDKELYSSNASNLTPSPGLIPTPNFSIGKVEIRYTANGGNTTNNTSVSLSFTSPRYVLRGKTTLGL